MLTAVEAAEYLLASAEAQGTARDYTNLKLQKLLYYAQGLHLAEYGEPMFAEDFQAWRHGPVCPTAYHEFKHCGSNPVPARPVNPWKVSARARHILDQVIDEYGPLDAWTLRCMTHAERPWRGVYKDEKRHQPITKRSLKEFFGPLRERRHAIKGAGQAIEDASKLVQDLSFLQSDPAADGLLDRLFAQYAPAAKARRQIAKRT